MAENTTFIDQAHVNQLVNIAGNEIRTFLQYLAESTKHSNLSRVDNNQTILSQVEPAIVDKVKHFISDPEAFSDQELVAKGKDFNKAIAHPIRIEVRTLPNIEGAAQIAVRGISRRFRKPAVERMKTTDLLRSDSFYVRMSGSASFEINRVGVDKALGINYLRHKWEAILKTIKYKPGDRLDCRKTQTVVCADGDGTTFAGPSLSKAPTIKGSRAYDEIVKYLAAGGIYVIISGNHLQRTISRVKGFVPDEYISRLMIIANGGANMVYFDQRGEVWELTDYRERGLDCLAANAQLADLDMIYIGDDGRQAGNDREAFEAVGADRSILVAKAKTDDIIPFLSDRHVGGLEAGTQKVMEFINAYIEQKPKQQVFAAENLSKLVQKSRDPYL